MVPMAMLVGRKGDAWGRKPLFLAAFLILPIRGALYTCPTTLSMGVAGFIVVSPGYSAAVPHPGRHCGRRACAVLVCDARNLYA